MDPALVREVKRLKWAVIALCIVIGLLAFTKDVDLDARMRQLERASALYSVDLSGRLQRLEEKQRGDDARWESQIKFNEIVSGLK